MKSLVLFKNGQEWAVSVPWWRQTQKYFSTFHGEPFFSVEIGRCSWSHMGLILTAKMSCLRSKVMMGKKNNDVVVFCPHFKGKNGLSYRTSGFSGLGNVFIVTHSGRLTIEGGLVKFDGKILLIGRLGKTCIVEFVGGIVRSINGAAFDGLQ